MRHFLTLHDFSRAEILEMLELSASIKKEAKAKVYKPYLKDETLAMIFEKSSTRTRVSFEVGMHQLGGKALFLSSRDIQLGRGESVKDTARVLGGMVDMIMARVYRHEDLEELARYSGVPVINGLSDRFHPAQVMADLLTAREAGLDVTAMRVAYVGDGNNMAHSWLMAAGRLGFSLSVATPEGYGPEAAVLEKALAAARESGAEIRLTRDPRQAVRQADLVTTDTWVSMGQEAQKERRLRDFAGFCVDGELMALAREKALFLHCLPAYRGREVSEEVFEAHAGEIFSEAENRLHAQKGVMVWLSRRA